MDFSTLFGQLPTTAIGLIGFIITLSFASHAWLVRFFMTYIQKKNANLERTTENFTRHLEELHAKHDRERQESEQRLRECLISK